MSHSKKFFLILFALIIITAILLSGQIKKAIDIVVKPSSATIIGDSAVYIPYTTSSLIYGNPGAPITVAEFTDFDCQKCAKLHKEIVETINKDPKSMRLMWYGFPARKIFSTDTSLAHQAAYCASKQNKFWQFVSSTMQTNQTLNELNLKTIANSINLNQSSLQSCLNSSEAKQAVSWYSAVARDLGIQSAPLIFVNNTYVNTNENIDLKDMLKKFLEK